MKPVNRVLLAFKAWDEKKNELQPLLKNSDEQTLDGLQLQHLRQATYRLRNTARPDEQPFMALLNNHVARLEKKLYPNVLQRIFFRLKDRFIDGPAYLKQQSAQRNHNMENLKAQLKEKGLGSIAGQLEKHLDPDHKQTVLPLDCQLGQDKRLNFDVHFEKDVYGNFQLTKLYGSLLEKDEVKNAYDFELAQWPGLKTNQAWSLLEGRALKQAYMDATGHENSRWVELGQEGVRYYGEPLFDVADVYKVMPQIGSSKAELTRYLENGQRAPALWKVGQDVQQIYVQADPANRSFKFYNNQEQAITPEKLNEQVKKIAPVAQQQQKRRNGHRLHI